MNVSETDIRTYSFWKALTEIPSVEAIYTYGARQDNRWDIAVLCPEATSTDWEKFMDIVRRADAPVPIEVVRLDALEPSSFRKELLATKSLAYYKPSKAYKQFIPEIAAITETSLRELQKLLADPKLKDADWLNAMLSQFRRAVYSLLRLLRRALLMTGMRVEAPVLILRQAMACGWAENRSLWENMHEDYQYSTQSCTPPVARDIIRNIPEYMTAIRVTLSHIHTIAAEAHA